ncbi:hypothetical protein HK098_003154 [Nowakowskiella sp. JEL0407]|nr:hypothetical protein HK098_003154 [Nowakowskiella sp. JEL0407]
MRMIHVGRFPGSESENLELQQILQKLDETVETLTSELHFLKDEIRRMVYIENLQFQVEKLKKLPPKPISKDPKVDNVWDGKRWIVHHHHQVPNLKRDSASTNTDLTITVINCRRD